jgi:hypothetical protein
MTRRTWVELGPSKNLTPFAKRLDNWVLLFGLNLATLQPKKEKKKTLSNMQKKIVKKICQSHQGILFLMNSSYSRQ